MPLACLHKVHEPDLVLEEMGSFVVKWAHSALPYFVKLRKEFEQAISFSNHCPKSLTKKSKTRTASCLSTVTEVLFHLFLYFMLIWLLITQGLDNILVTLALKRSGYSFRSSKRVCFLSGSTACFPQEGVRMQLLLCSHPILCEKGRDSTITTVQCFFSAALAIAQVLLQIVSSGNCFIFWMVFWRELEVICKQH